MLFAAAVYLGCIVSPPSLMDDVDAVQAQIARNMLSSGDWVTARLDGVVYLEKPPLIYWMIAGSYKVFGVHDWAARIPIALSAVALCLVTALFGAWAFGQRAGFFAGMCMSTCVGLWLFTRILIPDVVLTFTIALGMWAFLRVLEPGERHSRAWAATFAATIGIGLLLKSLIALVFPVGAAIVYLICTRELFSARVWKRLHPWSGLVIILLIAAPWHILATLRNPPYFSLTMKSIPGEYHGFLWFFFINEQLLRFLNLRYPPDYATVPRLYFWLFHLIWLFPWSVYLPATFKLSYKPIDRAGRTRLMTLCWIGFVLVFFTFSTTQEYYSMPVYPALALLLGSAMDTDSPWILRGTRALAVVSGLLALVLIGVLAAVWRLPTPGDISEALAHQATYKLSLGHMQDLTLHSFAYLRLPLAMAAAALAIGALGTIFTPRRYAYLPVAVMMVVFFQAARVAMVRFDPYLSSRPLAEALERSPQGELIVNHHYYWFSSVFFYTNRSALLLNGRFNNMVYGSYAPNAPNVFLNDGQFKNLWLKPERYYVVTKASAVSNLESLVGSSQLNTVAESGGKVLFTNHPLASAGL